MKIFTVCLNYGGKQGLVQGVAPVNSPEQPDWWPPRPRPRPLTAARWLFLTQVSYQQIALGGVRPRNASIPVSDGAPSAGLRQVFHKLDNQTFDPVPYQGVHLVGCADGIRNVPFDHRDVDAVRQAEAAHVDDQIVFVGLIQP